MSSILAGVLLVVIGCSVLGWTLGVPLAAARVLRGLALGLRHAGLQRALWVGERAVVAYMMVLAMLIAIALVTGASATLWGWRGGR